VAWENIILKICTDDPLSLWKREKEKGYFVTRSYQTISAFSPC